LRWRVADLQAQLAVDGHCDGGLPGFGVAGDVGQCLGDDPVCCSLDRRRQRRQRRRGVQDDRQTLASEPVNLLTETPQQPKFVQGRRSQVLHHPAQVSDGLLGIPAQLRQEAIGLIGGRCPGRCGRHPP
jgi:hypothetical protein